MTDQLRKGQRVIVYARLKDIFEGYPPSPFEIWLWNLPDHKFDKVMKWRLE